MSFRAELLFPLIIFSIATLFTPGPNNVMLMTAALNFGLRRALGAILGVAFGFGFLVLCVGLGLGALFTAYPIAYVVMKYAGGLYLLYLAWAIATSEPSAPNAPKRKRPLNFFEAAAFQWINPKGWVMAVGATATYAGIAAYPLNIAVIAGLFTFLGLGSTYGWAGLGAVMQKFLHRPKIVRAFNITMAILLVISLYPIFSESSR